MLTTVLQSTIVGLYANNFTNVYGLVSCSKLFVLCHFLSFSYAMFVGFTASPSIFGPEAYKRLDLHTQSRPFPTCTLRDAPLFLWFVASAKALELKKWWARPRMNPHVWSISVLVTILVNHLIWEVQSFWAKHGSKKGLQLPGPLKNLENPEGAKDWRLLCLFTIRRPKTTAQLRRIQDTTHSKKRTQGSPWISWQLQVASKHSKEHTTWHTQRGFTTAMVYLKIGYALW